MAKKKTSILDIAEALNVSKSTVSFVINGKGKQYNISESTQELVLKKAKELNYIPAYFSKTLGEGKTKTIGLVLADVSNPFYAELAKSIQDHLHKLGYSLFIVSTNDDEQMELKLIRDLILRAVDGLIIAPCSEVEDLQQVLLNADIPVVWVDRKGGDFEDFVGVNNFDEAYHLMNHFSSKPKQLTVLTPEHENVMTIQMRLKGVKAACEDQKVTFNHLAYKNDVLFKKQLVQLIDKGTDSIVALNNKIALKAIKLFNEMNVTIPNKIRLISFDDSEVFQYMSPAISALRQPIQQIGMEVAERMLERIQGGTETKKHSMFECFFEKRASH